MPSELVAPSAVPVVLTNPELPMLFELPVTKIPRLPGPEVVIVPLLTIVLLLPLFVLMPAELTVRIVPEFVIAF